MKLTTRCGSAAVDGLNEALLAKAAEAKLLRTHRIRVDTTVVAAGGAVRTKVRDRSLAAGRRTHEIAAKLRTRSAAGRGEAQATVRRVTGELAELAATAAAEAQRLLVNAKRALHRAQAQAGELHKRGLRDAAAGRRRGRLARAVNELTGLLDATRQIVAQTRHRVAGITPDGATRRVSLHDGDARPIAKGRLGRPVEFGQKAQLLDNDDGVVLDHYVEQGNPPDAPQLAPAVARVKKRAGRTPGTVTADRGYGEAKVDQQLHDLGVKTVVIPRKVNPPKRGALKNTEKPSAAPSNGAPGPKAASAVSNADMAGTAPASTARRHPDLDRTRDPRPQPGQDQRPRHMTAHLEARRSPGPASPPAALRVRSSTVTFSGRSS
jgi:IS5 family transposase